MASKSELLPKPLAANIEFTASVLNLTVRGSPSLLIPLNPLQFWRRSENNVSFRRPSFRAIELLEDGFSEFLPGGSSLRDILGQRQK
jgi:hypothetical protein